VAFGWRRDCSGHRTITWQEGLEEGGDSHDTETDLGAIEEAGELLPLACM
jgi:hypothetical protein